MTSPDNLQTSSRSRGCGEDEWERDGMMGLKSDIILFWLDRQRKRLERAAAATAVVSS